MYYIIYSRCFLLRKAKTWETLSLGFHYEMVKVADFIPAKWRDSNSRHPAPKGLLELFSNNFRSVLASFIPDKLLFRTLVSTASACSEAVYGQKCGQKPLPAQFGKRFVHSEDLFKAILPGRLHHLLYTGGERFHMFWANSAEIVPQRCLGEF